MTQDTFILGSFMQFKLPDEVHGLYYGYIHLVYVYPPNCEYYYLLLTMRPTIVPLVMLLRERPICDAQGVISSLYGEV
jgi:hypothetical protein